MRWSKPNGWIWGWIDTTVPGYRKLRKSTGAVNYTVTDGYYRFPEYISALDTLMSGGDGARIGSTGQVTLTMNGGSTILWQDRLGWLCGFGDIQPGTTSLTATDHMSILPSPAGIPLYGATWTEVNMAQETSLVLSRFSRAHSYAYGTARVWRWKMVMSKFSVDAMRSGWVLAGKITIASEAPDFSSGQWAAGTPGGG